MFCQGEILDNSWRDLSVNKDQKWLCSKEALETADNVLLYQRTIGGWPKNIQMHRPLSSNRKKEILINKTATSGVTTDNGATSQEMVFLSNMYRIHKDHRYSKAFARGINYLLEAQYTNGGWPQYYPLRKGYYSHVTYNDNSMVNILRVLKKCIDEREYYKENLDYHQFEKIKFAFDKGIDCILRTQFCQDGTLTSWCAQYEAITLLPAKARAYELPSLSGKESAQITKLLMSINDPKEEIVEAINGAVQWFNKVKINGLREIREYDKNNKLIEKYMIEETGAPTIWPRFMDLKDNTPFFCDRDGIKKFSLAEIGKERRNGYAWYTHEPKEVIDQYYNWSSKIDSINKQRIDSPINPLGEYKIIVDQNGNGDYTGIQQAINASKSFPYERVIIHIKNGIYYEKVKIHSWNTKISLVGENKFKTIIRYDDYFDKINLGRNSTFYTATLQVEGNDFYATNLTIENTAGASADQAIALSINADRVKIEQCNINGFQDTFYASGEGNSVYVKDTYICGSTDYIFGEATVFFENCEIKSLSDSYISAASTPKNIPYGFVFINCKLTAAEGVSKVYLGRPWRKYAKTAFINCTMNKHIVSEGWHDWENDEARISSQYIECNNSGEGANLDNRVYWSHQISSKELDKFCIDHVLMSDTNCHFDKWYKYSCTTTTTIYTIGDSTMSNKENPLDNPERGWAQMLFHFLPESYTLNNYAANGRSSKSFLEEGRWKLVVNSLHKNDYVLIQFGHNDQKINDKLRYTEPYTQFRDNLIRYVKEARSTGANPILLTPIVRRKFNTEGILIDTHGDYPKVIRMVASEFNVPLIDLQLITEKMEQTLGVEESKKIHLHFSEGEHPYYPHGIVDDTHLSEFGASLIAKEVMILLEKLMESLSK